MKKITLLCLKHWHDIFVTFYVLNSSITVLGLQQNYRKFLKTEDLTDVDLNFSLSHVTRTLGPSLVWCSHATSTVQNNLFNLHTVT